MAKPLSPHKPSALLHPQILELKDSALSEHLHLVRGLAALAVVVGHVRGLFFVDSSQAESLGTVARLTYFAAGFGHHSVILFFVLSGLLISRTVLRSWERNVWSWRVYLAGRLTRLYLVLIPALLLGLVWDTVGQHLPNAAHLYTHPIQNFLQEPVAERLTIGVLAGNVFFLQGITVPTFGSNGPLWSLANEFWYYMLFPLAVMAVHSTDNVKKCVWPVLVAIGIATIVGKSISTYFLIWLMGASINYLPVLRYARRATMRVSIALSASTFSAAMVWSRADQSAGLLGDFLVGLSFGALLYALSVSGAKSYVTWYSKLGTGLSGFSYTLYLVHFPLLLLLRAVITPNIRWQPDAIHLSIGCLVVLLLLAYAFAISRVTEFHTDALKIKILLSLGRSQAPPVRAAAVASR